MDSKICKYYIDQYRGSYITSIFTVFCTLIQFLPYYFIFVLLRQSFDVYIPNKNFESLIKAILLISILYLCKAGITFIVKYTSLKITKNIVSTFRNKIIEKIESLNYLKIAEIDTWKLHVIAVQHTEKLNILNSNFVRDAIPAIIAACLFLLFLFYTNLQMTFVLVILVLPLSFWTQNFLQKLSNQIKESNKNFRKFNKRVIFLLRALDFIKTLAVEDYERKQQLANIEALKKSEERLSSIRILMGLIQDIALSFFGIIILLMGGHFVINGTMTLGSMLSYYAAAMIFKNNLQIFLVSLPQIQEGKESLVEIYDFLNISSYPIYKGTKKINFSGKIVLRGVNFSYDNHVLLQDLSLTIHPGKIVVISGGNGAGKSTLLNILIGLIKPNSGQIFADEYNYDEIDMSTFRQSLGILRQMPFIFSDTILENITYGKINVSLDEIIKSANLSGILDFINGLPQKFNTRIGENGMNLSGGQCQKIAIARVFLNQPNLILFDEPTNQLDLLSVTRFINNLKSINKKRPSCIIISHESEIIKMADVHYELINGKLILQGT